KWTKIGDSGPAAVPPWPAPAVSFGTFMAPPAQPATKRVWILAIADCACDRANSNPLTSLPCSISPLSIVDLVAGDNNLGLRVISQPLIHALLARFRTRRKLGQSIRSLFRTMLAIKAFCGVAPGTIAVGSTGDLGPAAGRTGPFVSKPQVGAGNQAPAQRVGGVMPPGPPLVPEKPIAQPQ